MRNLPQVILISTLLAMPSYAAADETPATADQARVERLEQEVKQLSEELHRVRMQYIALQTQLDSVRNIIGDKNNIVLNDGEDVGKQLCLTKLMDANNTLAKLKSLGYTAQHPDMVNVSRNAESLMLECGQSDSMPSGGKPSGN